jgi:hypothetical protein
MKVPAPSWSSMGLTLTNKYLQKTDSPLQAGRCRNG